MNARDLIDEYRASTSLRFAPVQWLNPLARWPQRGDKIPMIHREKPRSWLSPPIRCSSRILTPIPTSTIPPAISAASPKRCRCAGQGKTKRAEAEGNGADEGGVQEGQAGQEGKVTPTARASMLVAKERMRSDRRRAMPPDRNRSASWASQASPSGPSFARRPVRWRLPRPSSPR
jgi:hypothetical protein